MPTCAFLPCAEIDPRDCPLAGGCVNQRFVRQEFKGTDLKDGARALAGIKPARTNRDPSQIRRRRKALQP